jgi:uncharacterized protein YegJ (DUF2314 family)
MRLIGISLISFVLFFPAYWIGHYFFGENIGAAFACICAFVVFPFLLSKIWKYYPPIDVVAIDPDDEFNKDCIKRARAELDRLEEGLRQGEKEVFVKYTIQADSESADHVWGVAHSIIDGAVSVSLVNDPMYGLDESKHSNPREKIPLSDIQDWMLIDKDGSCEGGYTHLAIVNAYKKQHGKVPKKYLKDLSNFVDIQESEYA